MPRPNFLFITTDQQRWDAVGIHNPRLRTPHMDRLGREGMRFDRAYPTNAICMPSRASMITGRSQRGHQVFNHDVNLSEAIPVLGDALRPAGYQTALIGKAHFRTADIEDILPDHPPDGGRTAGQVVANGGGAAVGALLVAVGVELGWAVLEGALATAQSDTWATEIGMRSGATPRMVTTGRPARVGVEEPAVGAATTEHQQAGNVVRVHEPTLTSEPSIPSDLFGDRVARAEPDGDALSNPWL